MSPRLIFLLAALVFAWLFAFNSGRELAYNLAYLLTAILTLSYGWAWNSTRFVQINRYTRARRSQVGQFFEETFEIRNRGRLPKLWLELRDYSTVPFHEVSRVVNSLQPKGSQRWQVRTLCQQRGLFRLGSMSLHSGDPLGLFSVGQTLALTSDLIVYPATVELNSFQPPIADLAGGDALSRRTQFLTTNVSGIREYAPGDSFNRIHWLSTARTGRLMTKEFELDPSADIWIFLDLFHEVEQALAWRPERPDMGVFSLSRLRSGGKRYDVMQLPPSTTEYGVTIAASVARYFLLRNRAVGMMWNDGGRQFLQTDRGQRQIRKMLESLAVSNAVGQQPFDELLLTEGARLNRNDILIAISPDPRPDWARALRELRRRGVNSIAVVVNGESFGGRRSCQPLLHELEISAIPTYPVKQGDALESALGKSAGWEFRRW
ncbi:MAG: DUF58 domain-containing protein [Caldilineaceae bacterium]|nr:DUF58 domain-containing protein [Caldilineaceae bacterium]HRJ42397.1 DUF58 domain-containing protein [Caldilineaceae bacterium]